MITSLEIQRRLLIHHTYVWQQVAFSLYLQDQITSPQHLQLTNVALSYLDLLNLKMSDLNSVGIPQQARVGGQAMKVR